MPIRHLQIQAPSWDALKGNEGAVKVLAKPLPIISQQSWLTREVPIDWKLSDLMPVYKKGQKDPGELQACQPPPSTQESV